MLLRRVIFISLLLIVSLTLAQPWSRVNQRSSGDRTGKFIELEGGVVVNEDTIRTARETASHSTGTPHWTNAPGFEHDVFTFTRIIFQSDTGSKPRFERLRWLGWWVDYPDADLNISHRIQQTSSARTDPDARVLKLTSPDLYDYPLIFMEHAGYIDLDQEEVKMLRNYLENGGALFVTDFWGREEWEGFARAINNVFPGRQWKELTTEHPVFNFIFDLRRPLNDLVVPTMQLWNANHDPDVPGSQLQRMYRGEGAEYVRAQAMFDDDGRMMILAIHNSDVSDGWEREGENQQFFDQYSDKVAYPLGMNVIFYFMTH